MALLKQNEFDDIFGALLGLYVTGNRQALLQFISTNFLATLNAGLAPNAQLLSDLGKLNERERLANGETPLQIYLRNAALLLSGTEEEKLVRITLDKVSHIVSGAPKIDAARLPETKEKIIFTDDTVTFAFMKAGVEAGTAVMKLRVPRFENGQPRLLPSGNPMIYLGTGWLLTESLVMTNHHVINARNDGETDASETDLRQQTQGIKGQFDFDADGLAGTETNVENLEAWDKTLDYAVLRVPVTTRRPLRRAAQMIQAHDRVPVNIIQHPGGRSKRYGIRNNLVSAATATELRYFTDTESGSSGSPVFNDLWEVVALHRASTYVADVQFQGKTTAYVNLGTQLSVILDDLRNRYPTLAQEIGL